VNKREQAWDQLRGAFHELVLGNLFICIVSPFCVWQSNHSSHRKSLLVQQEYRHLVLTKNKNKNAYTRNYIRDPKLWFHAESTRKLQRMCSLATYTQSKAFWSQKLLLFLFQFWGSLLCTTYHHWNLCGSITNTLVYLNWKEIIQQSNHNTPCTPLEEFMNQN
jgi:hypothetical protein